MLPDRFDMADPPLADYQLMVRLVEEAEFARPAVEDVPTRRDVPYYEELVHRQTQALTSSYAVGIISAFLAGLSLAGFHRLLQPPAAILLLAMALAIQATLLVALNTIYYREFSLLRRERRRHAKDPTESGELDASTALAS